MRFSYCMLPDYPLDGLDRDDQDRGRARLLRGLLASTRPGTRTSGVLFAAAADKTKRIRFGPNVTHVFLREPTLICQPMATLDELTGGRAEVVVSTGNFGLLAQYRIDWAARKPLSRLKEALHVMRTFLDEGAITFEGDFFKYSGLFTFARPVQERMPLKMGAMKGPRSFQRRGRDRRRHAPGARLLPRGLRLRGRERARSAPSKAGRDFDDLDIGAWVVTVVGEDSRGGQAGGADPRRVLHLLDAGRAARAPRHRRRASSRRWSTRSAAGDVARRDRAVRARARREAVGRRARPEEVRREDQARHRAGRA